MEVNGKTNTLNSIFGPDPLNLFGVVILTSLGTWGLPQMVHKFYAIKSEKEIGKGAVISTFFALIVAGGSYLLGGFDRLFCTLDGSDSGKAAIATLSNGKPEYDAMIPATLQAALPDLLIGLVVVLVLSASMSTLSSLVLTSSSTLTIDLIRPKMKKTSEKKEVVIMRVLIAVPPDLRFHRLPQERLHLYPDVLFLGCTGSAFLGPFMYGLFSKKVTKAAVGTSFVLGIGLTLLHMFLFGFGWFPELTKAAASLPLNMASPINAGAIA
ncbi:MAG: sodium:solute symporter family transporter [Ruminococcus sp.]